MKSSSHLKPYSIEIEKSNNKDWVFIRFRIGDSEYHWMPSFIDYADILDKIGECEERKYPQTKGLKRRKLPFDFIKRIMDGSYKGVVEIKKIYDDEFDPNKKRNKYQ